MRKAWKINLKPILQLLLSENSKQPKEFKVHMREHLSIDDVELLHKSWDLVKLVKMDEPRFKCIDIRHLYELFELEDKKVSNTELFCLRFYDNLFYDSPSLRMHFPTETIQRKAFLAMVNAVLFNCEFNLQNEKKFKEAGKKHFEHFKIPYDALSKFADAFYRTLNEFLTDKFTEIVQKCWKMAFNIVVTMMTDDIGKNRFSEIEIDSGLSQEQVQLIRSSWESLENKDIKIKSLRLRRLNQELLHSKGDEVLKPHTVFCIKFFDNLFYEYSEMQAYFPSAQVQSKAFTGLLFTLVEKVDYLDQYEDKIRELGKKHSDVYAVKPEAYRCLSNSLLGTLKEFLMEDFSVDIRNAWKDALDQIIAMMIEGPLKKEKKYSETVSSGSRILKRNRLNSLQIALIQKTWQKLEVFKPNISKIHFLFISPDLLNESTSPTTVFSLVFYDFLFQENAKLQIYFPNILSKSRAFGGMMHIMVKKIENLDDHEDKIRELGRKHVVEYKVTLEMFNNMQQAVLKSLVFLLADEMDSETIDAWNDAFTIIIDLMIDGPKKKRKTAVEEPQLSKTASVDLFGSVDRHHKEMKDYKP